MYILNLNAKKPVKGPSCSSVTRHRLCPSISACGGADAGAGGSENGNRSPHLAKNYFKLSFELEISRQHVSRFSRQALCQCETENRKSAQ